MTDASFWSNITSGLTIPFPLRKTRVCCTVIEVPKHPEQCMIRKSLPAILVLRETVTDWSVTPSSCAWNVFHSSNQDIPPQSQKGVPAAMREPFVAVNERTD